MKAKISQFSTRHPKWVFIGMLLVTVVCAALIPNILVDTDPENMLPEGQQDRVFHNLVKDRFNLYDAIVVGAVEQTGKGIYNSKSLRSLEQLARGIEQIDGVVKNDMLALTNVDNITQQIVGQGDSAQSAIKFEWMMKTAPQEPALIEQLARNVERLPLLKNTLVSQDQQAAAIYVPIKDKDQSYQIAQKIQSLIDDLASDDQYHITGLPVAEDTFGFQMFVQMGISAPLAALMIFVLMWLFFRNFKFIAAPMVVAMATVIITMGLLIGLGFTVHIMSSMIAIFLMPIAVVDSIHIMSEFADRYQQGKSRKELIQEVVKELYTPMLYTSITSAVGFASLLLTPIPPVQIFGAFIAFGILLAFALTMLFIPAYLSVLKPEALASLQQKSEKASWLENALPKLGKKSLANSKAISIAFLVLVAIGLWGVSKIGINDNPIRWFKSDHSIRVADKALNKHFAGTYDAYIVLEANNQKLEQELVQTIKELEFGNIKQQLSELTYSEETFGTRLNQMLILLEDYLFEHEVSEEEQAQVEKLIGKVESLKSKAAFFLQPAALQQLEQLQLALDKSGYLGKTNSLADAVKTVNRELASGEQTDYKIPNSKAGVAQALLQYQSSHKPQDLWHMVTKDYSSTVIWLQMKSGDNQDMSKVKDYLELFLEENPLLENIELKWAGKTYLNMVWQDEMVKGMATSLLGAFVAVFVMMVILFRSLLFGLLAMLPLTITIIMIYGLIGWIGKDYDMPIAVLSALTLGLSVDFSIHFLQRARTIFAQTQDMKKTMSKMFVEPANAISRNAIVIALGFTPLLLAPLMPYVTVGFFLASIMAVSALVTLVLLPIALKALEKRL